MRRQMISVTVCDLCGHEPATQHRLLHNRDHVMVVDLCRPCEQPLLELLDKYKKVTHAPRPGSGRAPHSCRMCKTIASRRSHAVRHVHLVHGLSLEEARLQIQPVGVQ